MTGWLRREVVENAQAWGRIFRRVQPTWLLELRVPALKCARLDRHKPGVERRKGYRRPDFTTGEHRHYVAMGVTEERPVCQRCGLALGGWKEKRREGYTGTTWPGDMAEKFKADGFFWTSTTVSPD